MASLLVQYLAAIKAIKLPKLVQNFAKYSPINKPLKLTKTYKISPKLQNFVKIGYTNFSVRLKCKTKTYYHHFKFLCNIFFTL